MRKVFIDGGAFNGASIRKFINDYNNDIMMFIHK